MTFPYSGIWPHESASSPKHSGPERPDAEEGCVLDPARHSLEGGIPGIGAIGHAPYDAFFAFPNGGHLMTHLGAFEDDHGVGRGRDNALMALLLDHQPGSRQPVGLAAAIDDRDQDGEMPALVEIVV